MDPVLNELNERRARRVVRLSTARRALHPPDETAQHLRMGKLKWPLGRRIRSGARAKRGGRGGRRRAALDVGEVVGRGEEAVPLPGVVVVVGAALLGEGLVESLA